MLASLNFIEKFISLPKVTEEITVNNKSFLVKNFDIPKIVPLLTQQGFEVEKITHTAKNLHAVVLGRIISTTPHPAATKLQICQVSVGVPQKKQIVCGAPNARPGLWVAVALPGATLPQMPQIQKSSIRGIESEGMLCSQAELGLLQAPTTDLPTTEDANGIWEISGEDVVSKTGLNVAQNFLEHNEGAPVFHALGLADTLLEISITANRPDLLCHRGLAQELAAGFEYAGILYEKSEAFPFSKNGRLEQEILQKDILKNATGSFQHISFCVENNLGCDAFFVLLDGVTVQPKSPTWLRHTLQNLGHNCVNTLVDALNYILLAYGQPSHAFDFKKLSFNSPQEKKLVFRYAKPQEKFLGLDQKQRELTPQDEVVSDQKHIQALLGVLGSQYSQVCEDSTQIILEFANPNPVSVRKASRRHGRQTDASFLFEKGIDTAARAQVARECVELILTLSPQATYHTALHSVDSQGVPVCLEQDCEHLVSYSSLAQERILGATLVSYKTQLQILKSLGCELGKIEKKHMTNLPPGNNDEKNFKIFEECSIKVPSWRRRDLTQEADLVEEFIRIVGINQVPAARFLSPATVNPDDPHFAILEKLSARCAALGYNEVMSLHFMQKEDHQKLAVLSNTPHFLGEPLTLLNSVLGDEPLLHTTLIPDLLHKVSKNLDYGVKSGQLFHSCRTFQNHDVEGNRVFPSPYNAPEHDNPGGQNMEKILITSEYHHTRGYCYSKEKSQKGRPVETPRLAGVLFGNHEEKTWQNTQAVPWTLHDVMRHVQELCQIGGFTTQILPLTHEISSAQGIWHPLAQALHPGKRVGFYLSEQKESANSKTLLCLGWAGELHPQTMRNYHIDTLCFAFEINVATFLDKTFKSMANPLPRKMNLKKFPHVSKDFSFILSEKITAQELSHSVTLALSALLDSQTVPAKLRMITIFDLYQNTEMKEHKKHSVTFRIVLEPQTRTLEEKDLQLVQNAVIAAITQELQGELRS